MPACNLQVKQEGEIMMIRKAQMKDISRLAEIEVVGKRFATVLFSRTITAHLI